MTLRVNFCFIGEDLKPILPYLYSTSLKEISSAAYLADLRIPLTYPNCPQDSTYRLSEVPIPHCIYFIHKILLIHNFTVFLYVDLKPICLFACIQPDWGISVWIVVKSFLGYSSSQLQSVYTWYLKFLLRYSFNSENTFDFHLHN